MVGVITAWVRLWTARLGRSERAASLIEYALLIALIALVCIAALVLLGESTSSNITSSADRVSVAE
jgi:pilus assembly protein Flp/PilA